MYNVRKFNNKLINKVREYPVLFDVQHDQYSNIMLKNECWSEIARQMNAEEFDCRKRWKSLRDSFCQIIKNSCRAQDSGRLRKAAPESWPYFGRIKFLLPYTKYKDRVDMFGSVEHIYEESESEDEAPESEYVEDAPYDETNYLKDDENNDEAEQPFKIEEPFKIERIQREEPRKSNGKSFPTPLHQFFSSLSDQVGHFSNTQILELQLKCLHAAHDIEKEPHNSSMI